MYLIFVNERYCWRYLSNRAETSQYCSYILVLSTAALRFTVQSLYTSYGEQSRSFSINLCILYFVFRGFLCFLQFLYFFCNISISTFLISIYRYFTRYQCYRYFLIFLQSLQQRKLDMASVIGNTAFMGIVNELSHDDSRIMIRVAAIPNYDIRVCDHSHSNSCSVIHF